MGQDPRDVVRELEAWRETNSHELGHNLLYMYSVEWGKLYSRDWSRYDELDAQRSPNSDPERRTKSWDFVISDLEGFVRLFKQGDFRKTLSPSQKRSFELIIAWWNVAYFNHDLLAAAREFVPTRADKIFINDPTSREALEAASRHAKTILSLYLSALFDLPLGEFQPQA
ncbi:hypothetical protein F4679DRAFT_596582 [Xylaria curta]|nr:hypothetical protein F4679DRAFT_596582 [Xylaria curta]